MSPSAVSPLWESTPLGNLRLFHELHPTVLAQGMAQDPEHLRLLHVLGTAPQFAQKRWENRPNVDGIQMWKIRILMIREVT